MAGSSPPSALQFKDLSSAMKYFPLFMDLEGREVLLAGGGEKALQKLRLLSRTKARVTVVAETATAEVVAAAELGNVLLQLRTLRPDDVKGKAVALGAYEDPRRNAELSEAARAAGVPVNIVDAPDLSTVIVPAIVDRDPVVVAIGTEGAAPIVARDLRARIESWLPADFGRVASYAAALRSRARAAIAQPAARRQFWEGLLRGPFRDRALAGDAVGAEREAARALRDATKGDRGSVVLVGCGPGNPDLLTLKALQALQDADVLVHDRLVNPAILDYARRDAVRIDVGKAPGGKATPQDEINRILVREALKGQRVARLKGGDPMIFGRAAEEIAAVRAAGIDATVIPGITAAHAIAASVTLPLTLRGKVRQFAVVTGATEDGAAELDWQALAAPGQAFAIYMGVRGAASIQQNLIGAGAQPTTSVVIVENGTLPEERIIETTLASLGAAVKAKAVTAPSIVFVGLGWDEACLSRPARTTTFALHPSKQLNDNSVGYTPQLIGRRA
jgi:uroporphyrin-III C-methyltransferase/precorrin-2 dehydrogenase/sirohydrochlorin ferrochelatase